MLVVPTRLLLLFGCVINLLPGLEVEVLVLPEKAGKLGLLTGDKGRAGVATLNIIVGEVVVRVAGAVLVRVGVVVLVGGAVGGLTAEFTTKAKLEVLGNGITILL